MLSEVGSSHKDRRTWNEDPVAQSGEGGILVSIQWIGFASLVLNVWCLPLSILCQIV